MAPVSQPVPEPILASVLTCPHCGHAEQAQMPLDACQYFYTCPGCEAVLTPRAGDCCVFCSYGTVPCPPVQIQRSSATSPDPSGSNRRPSDERQIAATTGGAIGVSAFASFVGLCCVGPWAVGFLGVSGAVAMARLEPYRPVILGIALALLAWAYWRVYRPARFCPGGVCPTRRSRWLQALLWLALVLLVLAFFADRLQWLLVDPTPRGLRS